MNYWLFKSEPDVFSIADLQKRPKQTEPWDGVRNYQARNMLRDQVKVGDLVFFYHSNCKPPGIVGLMKVVKAGYPDSTACNPESSFYDPRSSAEKPIWYRVDVQFVKKFPKLISLDEIKQHPQLSHMLVARKGNRLSIMPVTKHEFDLLNNLYLEL
jgi:predicted RNA-binding protein with PUA-like domain